MAWRVVARQDGRLTAGARSVRTLLGLFALGVLITAYVYPVVAPDPITTGRFSGFVTGWLTTMLPLLGVLVGYNAVASERESGSLLLSLSFPHSRGDVVLGKAVGRTAVVAGVTLVAMLAAGALVVYPYGDLEPAGFLAFTLLTVAFAAVWTGLGIAVSLSVATKQRALVLAAGLFLLFAFLWDWIERALTLGLTNAGLVDEELPAALRFVLGLAPGRVFDRVTAGFVDPSRSVDGAWYLGEWAALAVFVLWLVVPLGLAASRFRGSDLT